MTDKEFDNLKKTAKFDWTNLSELDRLVGRENDVRYIKNFVGHNEDTYTFIMSEFKGELSTINAFINYNKASQKKLITISELIAIIEIDIKDKSQIWLYKGDKLYSKIRSKSLSTQDTMLKKEEFLGIDTYIKELTTYIKKNLGAGILC